MLLFQAFLAAGVMGIHSFVVNRWPVLSHTRPLFDALRCGCRSTLEPVSATFVEEHREMCGNDILCLVCFGSWPKVRTT